MKPLSWFMQPGSWATETSKTSMRQHWRLKPCNCCEKARGMQKRALPSSVDRRQNTRWEKIHCGRLERATKPTAGPAPNQPWVTWAERNREVCSSKRPTPPLLFPSTCTQENKCDYPIHCQLPLRAETLRRNSGVFLMAGSKHGNAAAKLLRLLTPCSPKHCSCLLLGCVGWDTGRFSP